MRLCAPCTAGGGVLYWTSGPPIAAAPEKTRFHRSLSSAADRFFCPEEASLKGAMPRMIGDRQKSVTLLLVAAGLVSLSAAIILGIPDNPPGLALVYVAVTDWILAFALRWRQVRSFLILLGASLLGFPLAVVLHNLFYALGIMVADVAPLRVVLGWLEVGFFLLAVLVCPPGVLIGAAGSLVLAIRRVRGASSSGEER
jgi:hypothetical protein